MRLLLCCLCCLLAGAVLADDLPMLALPEHARIVDQKSGDVTGDGVADHVFFLDIKADPDAFAEYQHALRIIDGATGRTIPVSLGEESNGIGTDVQLARIDDDASLDILVTVQCGADGGMGLFFLISASGGTPSVLIPSAKLSTPAKLNITLQDNYRMQVEMPAFGRTSYVDLKQVMPSSKERARQLVEIYAADGRVLQPDGATWGEYEVFDPVNVDDDDRDELVGYQGISVGAHSNVMASVRTVLDWQPGKGLVATGESVIPEYSLEQYREDIGKLQDTLAPAPWVKQAIGLYRAHFADEPTWMREEAFHAFREAHALYVIEGYAGDAEGEATYDAKEVARLNADPDFREAGVEFTLETGIRVRRGFYLENFGEFLAPATRAYLRLEDDGNADFFISTAEYGKHVRAWEEYLQRYPYARHADDAQFEFTSQLDFFLFGTPTREPVDETTGLLLAESKRAYEDYLRQYPDSLSARCVAEALAIYALPKEEREAAHQRYETAHNDESPQAYFPAALGSTWRYTVIGKTPSSYTLTAAYRNGTLVQLNRQEGDTKGYVIYDVAGWDKVAQISSAIKSNVTENRLNAPNSMYQVQILQPIQEKHRWTSNRLEHNITAIGGVLTVLGHTYGDVIMITRQPVGQDFPTIRDYYAAGVGLVRRDYLEDGRVVGQELLWRYQPGTE